MLGAHVEPSSPPPSLLPERQHGWLYLARRRLTYSKEGTVSAKEANNLFNETFKQKCQTVHEARHIVHGSGEQWESSEPGIWFLRFLDTR